MAFPPQLTPVQAWMLGHFDSPSLLDLVDGLPAAERQAQLEALGRVRSNEGFAAELLASAHRVLEGR